MHSGLRRSIAAFCALLALVNAVGCHKTTREPPSSAIRPGYKDDIVGLTLHDGREVRFDPKIKPRIANDSIHGTVRGQVFATPLSDVQRVWVRRIDPTRTTLATLGIVAGTLAAVVGIALATKESCPFVYSWDGERYVFDAEPYGGAITRGLERDDYSKLEHLRADQSGTYRLMVTNEVNETQYTNAMRLVVVDHPRGTTVDVDEHGRPYALATVTAPSSARDQNGVDLLPWLRATDLSIWEPSPGAATEPVRREVVLTFSKPVGATRALLVADAATGIWGSHMIREFLELRGSAVREWYTAIDTDPMAQGALLAWNLREELYMLKVYVEERDGWTIRGILPGGGPFIAEKRVIPIDISRVPGNTLRLRINPPAGFWALNSLGVSYDTDAPMTLHTVAPTSATADGRDILPMLAEADGRYYEMPNTGDFGYVSFPAPPQNRHLDRTVFLHTRGYYRLHLEEQGEPNVAALREITETPDAAARLAASRFGQRQASALLR